MRLFRHPRWQHLDYRLKVATTQENKPPTQGTRQWTFTTPRWRCGSILLPSLNAGVPEPTGGTPIGDIKCHKHNGLWDLTGFRDIWIIVIYLSNSCKIRQSCMPQDWWLVRANTKFPKQISRPFSVLWMVQFKHTNQFYGTCISI